MKHLTLALTLGLLMSISAEAAAPNTAVVVKSPNKMMHQAPMMKMKRNHLVRHRLLPVHMDAHSTMINVMDRFDLDSKMDQNHSLLKAQRYHRSMMGISTKQLAMHRNRVMANRRPASMANRAVVMRKPRMKMMGMKVIKIDMNQIEKLRRENEKRQSRMLVELKQATNKG